MKRKRWFAMILVLCLLISLMPLSFASATELAPGQIIPDGIYYIVNSEINEFLKVIDKEESMKYDMHGCYYPGFYYAFHEEYQIYTGHTHPPFTEMDARFLWKVEYIENGEYAITSVFYTDLMLTPGHELEDDDGVPLGVMDYQRGESGYVPIRFRWIIRENAGRYLLQWADDTIFTAGHANDHELPFVMGDNIPSSNAFDWVFISAPQQILFYTLGGFFNERPVCYIRPEKRMTLDDLGISVEILNSDDPHAEIIWTSSNTNIASVHYKTGAVTGVSYGDCEIIATHISNGIEISNSYRLKVAPYPEGTYYFVNRELGSCMGVNSDILLDENSLCLRDNNGEATQRWVLKHVNQNYYHIMLEMDTDTFYLSPADDMAAADGEVKLYRVTENSDIPIWEINTKGNNGCVISSCTSEGYLLQGKEIEESNLGSVYQDVYTGGDKLDEWILERSYSVRVHVFYDRFVDAYGENREDAFCNIKDQLQTMKEVYWEQFRISIDIADDGEDDGDGENTLNYLQDCYVDKCTWLGPDGLCHGDNCRNSYEFGHLEEFHHTNLANVLANSKLPQNDGEITILYVGHKTCGVYLDTTGNGIHKEHLWDGYAFPSLGLVAVNNFAAYKTANGGCKDNPLYYAETLIHEMGHMFGAVDHYGEIGVPSTGQIFYSGIKYCGLYNITCVYGERSRDLYFCDYFTFCDGCRATINDNKYRYNN